MRGTTLCHRELDEAINDDLPPINVLPAKLNF